MEFGFYKRLSKLNRLYQSSEKVNKKSASLKNWSHSTQYHQRLFNIQLHKMYGSVNILHGQNIAESNIPKRAAERRQDLLCISTSTVFNDLESDYKLE